MKKSKIDKLIDQLDTSLKSLFTLFTPIPENETRYIMSHFKVKWSFETPIDFNKLFKDIDLDKELDIIIKTKGNK